MRQTLFFIPHKIGPLPVFGIGWGLIALLLLLVVFLWRASLAKNTLKFAQEQFFVFAAAMGIIVFLLPRIESRFDDGTPGGMIAGLPVRGYGVLLLCGVLSAIWIALRRVEKIGISRESFFSLATWTVLTGIVGARLFYIIQKWEELDGSTITAKLYTSLQFTEGGLVVYGSVIGGLIAIVLWSRKNQQSLLPLADAIAPAFFIGLAFGRVGCLLNGCCYGGVCEAPLPSIVFPVGSPAYMDQLASGKLIGMNTAGVPSSDHAQPIESVKEGSWATSAGIKAGQKLVAVEIVPSATNRPVSPLAPPILNSTVQVDTKLYRLESSQLPTRSLPVHPSQIYAAIGGALLCLWTISLSTLTNRAGIVFGASLIAYGLLRIIEEIIRVDELGQFGTSFSIAQWISAIGILGGALLVWFANRGPAVAVTSAPRQQT